MASTLRGTKTYHHVPRFDMAADGGPLFLGAIFQDLKFQRPALNRDANDRVEVRHELMYKPVTLKDFRESLAISTSASLAAWFRCLTCVSGSVGVSGSRDANDVVHPKEVVTTYFDPDDEYLHDCFQARPIKEYLAGSNKWTAELYLITGLKVGKSTAHEEFKKSQRHTGLHTEGKIVQADVKAGGEAKSQATSEQHSKCKALEDIVVGYRVNKFRCKRRFNSNHEDRKFRDDGVVPGNMMAGQERKAEQAQVQFEAMAFPEEAALEGAAGGHTKE